MPCLCVDYMIEQVVHIVTCNIQKLKLKGKGILDIGWGLSELVDIKGGSRNE